MLTAPANVCQWMAGGATGPEEVLERIKASQAGRGLGDALNFFGSELRSQPHGFQVCSWHVRALPRRSQSDGNWKIETNCPECSHGHGSFHVPDVIKDVLIPYDT